MRLERALSYLVSAPLMSVRRRNVELSPKRRGSSDEDSQPYLRELGYELVSAPQRIQFQLNAAEPVHRWSFYVQGFSASFVQGILDRYRSVYRVPHVLDPFAGSGTVLVQAKMNGYPSWGVELNPFLHFLCDTKLNSWMVSPSRLLYAAERVLCSDTLVDPPTFLRLESQFKQSVLHDLRRIKGGIDTLVCVDNDDKYVKNLLLLAFASILVDSSNLKRSPCLGYARNKEVQDDAAARLFSKKINQITEDLLHCHSCFGEEVMHTPSEVILGDSSQEIPDMEYDLVITSPPYMNGMDYAINYKIELAWLGFVKSHSDIKLLKDKMVACDNISRRTISSFVSNCTYTSPFIERIKDRIHDNISRRGGYRRLDMPAIVHKYFDDMYRVMYKVIQKVKRGGRVVMVVGDSLIADVYIPTDLLLARMCEELGLSVERLEKARERRSGQVRSYRLRETIITMKKG
ncbi:MAG: site-specific DNA-methyltransferase [Thermoflexales bacterium]|nr:site-specific DNA-methyltransferase [Thermoflexales bacterium]